MMKKTSAFFWAIQTLALATLMASPAFADATSADTTGSSTAKAPSLMDKLAVSYWGIYNGPSLGTPSTMNPSSDGTVGPQNLNGYMYLGYMIAPTTKIAIVPAFKLQPFDNTKFVQNDIAAFIGDSQLIHTPNFNMYAAIRVYAPTSVSSQKANMLTQVRAEQLSTYNVPNSRFQLGSWATVGGLAYGANGSGMDFHFTFSPFVNYAMAKNVQATLWTDVLDYGHVMGTTGITAQSGVDIEPGINWDITPKLSINPFINFFPSNLTINTTSINMVISAKFI